MGVSSGDTDLSAIVGGGEAFAKRVAELKAAKAAADKSLEELNLGKSARALHDEAGRIMTQAKTRRDDEMAALDKELADARTGLNAWVEETKKTTMTAYNDAQSKLAAAANEHDAATAARKAADKVLADAKKEAATLVKDAEASAVNTIDRAMKNASDIVTGAKKIEAAAERKFAEAEAAKLKYEAAMERIKGAMV